MAAEAAQAEAHLEAAAEARGMAAEAAQAGAAPEAQEMVTDRRRHRHSGRGTPGGSSWGTGARSGEQGNKNKPRESS